MISVAGYPVQSASGEFHYACLGLEKPGSFLLEVVRGLDAGQIGKAGAAAPAVLSPVPLPWGVWSLLRALRTYCDPRCLKGVCFSLRAGPVPGACAWESSLQVVWRLPCCHLQWVSCVCLAWASPGQCPDPLPDHLTS